jgi:hypothetical protein
MFTGFQLHTTETIEDGRDELRKFSELMKVRYYIIVNIRLLAEPNM